MSDPHWLEMKVVDAALRLELGETLQALAAEYGLTPEALGNLVCQWHEARDETARLAANWRRFERVLAALPPPPAPVPSPPRAPPLPLPPWTRTLALPSTQQTRSPTAVAAPRVRIKSEPLAASQQHPAAPTQPAALNIKLEHEQSEGEGEFEEGSDSEFDGDWSDDSDSQCTCACTCGKSLSGARRAADRPIPRAAAGCSSPLDPR